MSIGMAIALIFFTSARLRSQTASPEKPVKTGDEWKMPSDVFKRARTFVSRLNEQLALDSSQSKKIYQAYVANTKPLDEIEMARVSEEEKSAKRKNNEAAFDQTLRQILTASQFQRYLKLNPRK